MKHRIVAFAIILITITTVFASNKSIEYNVAEYTLELNLSPYNLALGKTAYSPTESQNKADAENITVAESIGWTTQTGLPQETLFNVIDLGAEKAFNLMYFELNNATRMSGKWSVWISFDEEEWEEVFSQRHEDMPEGNANIKVEFYKMIIARYIKIQSDESRYDGANFGMRQVCVFNSGEIKTKILRADRDGNKVSVYTNAPNNEIVVLSVFAKDEAVRGVFYAPVDGGGKAEFIIDKKDEAEAIKVYLVKDLKSLTPLDCFNIE